MTWEVLNVNAEEVSFYLYVLVGVGLVALVSWVVYLDREAA